MAKLGQNLFEVIFDFQYIFVFFSKVKSRKHHGIAQWLAIVLGRHFKLPVLLGIYLICQYSPKSIVEFEFCAIKAISGSYGIENSQNFLKIAKNV